MIMIVGASGHLGRLVAKRLLAQGKQVRLMTRNPNSVTELMADGAEVVSGDLRNPDQLNNALQDIDIVVSAAQALNGKADNNPQTVDDQGNRNLIDAARKRGVNHFIFISIQGANRESPLQYFRIKYRVEEYLKDSSLNYTIIRPTAFMDLWGELIGAPILKQGNAFIFGSGNNPVNFVAVDDVAQIVSMACEAGFVMNQSIDVGGPENLTLNQVAEIFAKLSSHKLKITHIPVQVLRVLSLFMQPFNPTVYRLIQNGIFMDTADLRFDASDKVKGLPIPLTRFEEWSLSHKISLTDR